MIEKVHPINALGKLMVQYPAALMGTERLPVPKQEMKDLIKEAWRQEPGSRARLNIAYLHLSQFQDGIGNAILVNPIIYLSSAELLDPEKTKEAFPAVLTEMSGPLGSAFDYWLAWEKVSLAEMEVLRLEWEEFERGNSA